MFVKFVMFLHFFTRMDDRLYLHLFNRMDDGR
jgi:hypothetical protein